MSSHNSTTEGEAKPPLLEEPKSQSQASVESKAPPPPVDGGLVAWVQCAAGFCLFINTFGLLNSFGAFQAWYQNNLLHTSSASDISWIGTVQSSFIMMGSVYSGPLYDWGYLRALIMTGSFMMVFGMFMTSLCHEYWQVLLAQGFFIGIGIGCLFTPTVGVVASYFTKRRGLAMGIASAGSGTGGIIYPIIFNKLVGNIHFGWTVRVMAFIMLFLSILPVLGMRMRTKPPAVRRVFEAAAWKEPEFALYAAALFIGYVGMYIPYFYIQIYCLENNIITGDLNFYLLPILNAAGLIGRIVLGQVSDKFGPLNAFVATSGSCAVLLFGWIGIHSEAGVIVFCLLYGFFSAGLIALPATVVAMTLCPDMRKFGVRITMQLVPSAIGLLIGNPIAGAILPKGWHALQGFAAATVMACTCLAFAARIAKVGWSIKGKC